MPPAGPLEPSNVEQWRVLWEGDTLVENEEEKEEGKSVDVVEDETMNTINKITNQIQTAIARKLNRKMNEFQGITFSSRNDDGGVRIIDVNLYLKKNGLLDSGDSLKIAVNLY